MRIKQLLIGITASVIAISSYVEIAVADLKFPMLVYRTCLLYTSPSPRDSVVSRMPSSA